MAEAPADDDAPAAPPDDAGAEPDAPGAAPEPSAGAPRRAPPRRAKERPRPLWLPARRTLALSGAFLAPCVVLAVSIWSIVRDSGSHAPAPPAASSVAAPAPPPAAPAPVA